MTDEIEALGGDQPLSKLTAICEEIFQRWDADQRSGKLLTALAGRLPGYRADVDEVRAALSRPAPAAEVTEGWKLVPRKVTEEMLHAFDLYNEIHLVGEWEFQECWDSVLAASPP